MDTELKNEIGLCPVVEGAFSLLGKKWNGLIIHVLGAGPRRFSDILREIKELSPRVLTQRLKELECTGLVNRRVIPSTPVQVEYSLKEKGQQLIPLMTGIAEWAHTWAAAES
ncbi:MAG: helix-turn-helix transcriptional regulator [Spirochaetaceae bacterium]|nr:helix-turn-helix transcriptional regulator [Spirochaetaceae bacterium]